MFQPVNDSVLEQFGVLQTSVVPEKESANNTNTGKKLVSQQIVRHGQTQVLSLTVQSKVE
jgi:hypothetical protein